MTQTKPIDNEPSAELIESVAQEIILAISQDTQEFNDDFLQSMAMVHALTSLGMQTAATVMDICYEDSSYETDRLFGFMIDQEPCDMHGNIGWNAIIDHYTQANELTRNLKWFKLDDIDVHFDSHSIITDELSMREENFESRVEQLGGGALANVRARQLEKGSNPTSSPKTCRRSL
jgi:hypothetical protein